MPSHVIGFVLTISGDNFAAATRLRLDGNMSANPFALALAEWTTFELTGYTPEQWTARDLRTGQEFVGPVPAELADYLDYFHRGEPIAGEHIFELALSSNN